MSWIISIAVWVVLLALVAALGIYRVRAAHHLDSSFHLTESDTQAASQVKEEKSLEGMDFWGKLLTAVVILYGIGLAVAYGVHLWSQQPKFP